MVRLRVALVALLGCGMGCGDSVDAPTEAASGTGAVGGGTSSTTSAGGGGAAGSATASSSSSTGAGGDGNDGFDRAVAFDFGDCIDAALEPTGDADFYVFEGKKHQALRIDAFAQSLDDDYGNPEYVDTVVTLFDGAQRQIAQNDRAIPSNGDDAVLLTMLPEDGTYYLRVSECWSTVKNPGSNCADPKDKTFTDYSFCPLELDPASDIVTEHVEAVDEIASPTQLEYDLGNTGYYTLGYAFGTFQNDADVDVFAFTPPANTPVVAGRRPNTKFYFIPSGTDFSGATRPVGTVYVTTAADPTTRVAQIDGANVYLFVPLSLDVDYLLFLEHPGGGSGTNDFHIMRHTSGTGNPIESDEFGNDTLVGAEVLVDAKDEGAGVVGYYIEGDLVSNATDVDHFEVAVDPGFTMVEADCGASNWGSGLGGLTATILQADGTELVADSETQSQIAVAFTEIPQGASSIVLRVSATSQSSTVTGAFYRCGVYLVP